MWLFTVPVLLFSIKVAFGLCSLFMVVQVIRWSIQSKPPNPFEKDSRVERKPYEHDQKKRDAVLKQAFSKSKVPDELDAIIIGSGIGGLSCAAIMAKANKRVLVLEQHDQAGGCCHTYIDKGYEFDVGIHYVGEMGSQTINKVLVDQITEGQLEWAPLQDNYDTVSIGYGDENRQYEIVTGSDNWRKLLKTQFPDEVEAIDKYFQLMEACSRSSVFSAIMKLLPLWFVNLMLVTGILKLFTNFWSDVYARNTLDVVQSLTKNKDLQTVMLYCFGDYGTSPSKSNFSMQALLNRHFLRDGGHYPIGGASEIAYNIIPVIESSGGRVLVRVNVETILTKGRSNKVCGVRVKKGTETTDIFAPMVISSAGVYNTFQSLLPKEISAKSYFTDIAKTMKPGPAAMNIFIGFDASNEELGLRPHNWWAFASSDVTSDCDKYLEYSSEEALDAENVPLLFVSFPSAKDPEWKNHPGRENKSTCAIVTLANWDWFKKWEDRPVKKRGDDYDEVKKTIGEHMIEQTCQLFPQIRDHIDHIDIGTPVSNKYYIAQPHGEIYGLDHSAERFDPWQVAKLRPETDLPGLYLTGQDILTCGFTGALFGGLITAQVCLGRNVFGDLKNLRKKLREEQKSKDN